MIPKSIRVRLQLWYGLILVIVLTGFGLTAYRLEVGRQLRNVDEQIQRRMAALSTALRPGMMRPNGPGRLGPMGRGLRGRGPIAPLRDQAPELPERLPEDLPSDENGPAPFPPPRFEFHLTPRQAALFDESDTNGFYYVIWRRDGTELARSTNAPAGLKMPDHRIPRPPRRLTPPPPPPPRMRGEYREFFHLAPGGELALVGHSVAPERAELRRTAWKLTGVGGVILMLGLAGGWWIATRAIHPVEEISATAVRIAAGDLSQRINLAEADSELGRLAGVLNSTFARLEAAFSQQARFTSDAAHELRTPVSVMLTQTQTALHRERSAAEYRDTVEACQRAAQRMRRLIESLLELARLDAGQEQMKRYRFNLAEVARDCIELIRPLAEPRGIHLHSDLTSVECVGDSERLAQVITNLVSNAVHYNRDNGEVRITLAAESEMAVFSITDTGEGIAVEDLPHIFERFYRADPSRQNATNHTGLGLAISKAIVEAHGGTLEVMSQPGAGTTFVLRLPLESHASSI